MDVNNLSRHICLEVCQIQGDSKIESNFQKAQAINEFVYETVDLIHSMPSQEQTKATRMLIGHLDENTSLETSVAGVEENYKLILTVIRAISETLTASK